MGYKTTMELARDASDELVWQNGDSLNEYGVDVKVIQESFPQVSDAIFDKTLEKRR